MDKEIVDACVQGALNAWRKFHKLGGGQCCRDGFSLPESLIQLGIAEALSAAQVCPMITLEESTAKIAEALGMRSAELNLDLGCKRSGRVDVAAWKSSEHLSAVVEVKRGWQGVEADVKRLRVLRTRGVEHAVMVVAKRLDDKDTLTRYFDDRPVCLMSDAKVASGTRFGAKPCEACRRHRVYGVLAISV